MALRMGVVERLGRGWAIQICRAMSVRSRRENVAFFGRWGGGSPLMVDFGKFNFGGLLAGNVKGAVDVNMSTWDINMTCHRNWQH